jgi:RimJ/RimL family protein N-acetyltransferase
MPQATLHTSRILLVPLSDDHLEYEVELDADPQVMRYLTGRARTRQEVEVQHRRRLAAAERVPGLGMWVGFTGGEFVGLWMLQPPSPRPGPGRGAGRAGLPPAAPALAPGPGQRGRP